MSTQKTLEYSNVCSKDKSFDYTIELPIGENGSLTINHDTIIWIS